MADYRELGSVKKGLAANINITATKNVALEGELHYATDTKQLYIFDGTQNNAIGGGVTIGDAVTGGTADSVLFVDVSGNLGEDNAEFEYDVSTNTLTVANLIVKDSSKYYNSDLVDMGYYQDSNIEGYEADMFTDKIIKNSVVGPNVLTDDGGIRYTVNPSSGLGELQLYYNSTWNTALTGINLIIDSVEPDVEITNFGDWVLSLITGDSDLKDMNGQPLVQQLTVAMGSWTPPQVVNGGTF